MKNSSKIKNNDVLTPQKSVKNIAQSAKISYLCARNR